MKSGEGSLSAERAGRSNSAVSFKNLRGSAESADENHAALYWEHYGVEIKSLSPF